VCVRKLKRNNKRPKAIIAAISTNLIIASSKLTGLLVRKRWDAV
jgi:hypothetical protein